MTAFTITVQDQQVKAALQALSQRLNTREMDAMLLTIGAGIIERTNRRFETSTGPDGVSWKQLSATSVDMLTRRLTERTPSAGAIGTVFAEGHRLTFDKVSSDGSGKCHIHPTGNAADRVYGVLFRISSAEAGLPARVRVVDLAGRAVRTLVDQPLAARVHALSWDLRDDSGRDVPAGLYFLHARVGRLDATRRLIVVR